MHPATLRAGRAEHLRQRFPEAQRTITNRYFRIDGQPALFQVQQQFFPRLARLAIAIEAPVTLSFPSTVAPIATVLRLPLVIGSVADLMLATDVLYRPSRFDRFQDCDDQL